MANKLFITDTILRDGHQSKAATRMPLSDMLPACEALDNIGFWSLEVWGGATFDACLRYLNEDPWERLRQLRKALPKTKLQMLFRGQNILGYKNYADDVVEAFCRKAIENGIDIIRIFDALNDTRNLEAAIKYTKKYGGWCEPALSYTISPVHSEEYFVKLAKELVQMGADSICIKDMANLLLPYDAYSLVKKLKAEGKEFPEIFMACGTEDFLIERNRAMHKFLEEEGVAHTYWENPGIHDFVFWNKCVEKYVPVMFGE